MSRNLLNRYVTECFDGDVKAYRKARKDDYCKAQFEWTCWLDGLVKSGEVSQKVWQTATF